MQKRFLAHYATLELKNNSHKFFLILTTMQYISSLLFYIAVSSLLSCVIPSYRSLLQNIYIFILWLSESTLIFIYLSNRTLVFSSLLWRWVGGKSSAEWPDYSLSEPSFAQKSYYRHQSARWPEAISLPLFFASPSSRYWELVAFPLLVFIQCLCGEI